MPPDSIPYHCVDCMTKEACGYHGVLAFGNGRIPVCKHDEPPGKPCHEGRRRMVPVRRHD